MQTGFGLNRAAQGRGGSDRQLCRFLRTQIGPQQDGKPKSLPFGRNPFAAEPSPALRLRLGENHRALLDAIAGEFFDHVVRRGRLLEHVDVASDDLCFAEAREQIVRVQHVRRADQPVAEMRAGLDFVAEPAQFLDAPPDRRARDPQLLREVRARYAVQVRAQRRKNFCVRGHFKIVLIPVLRSRNRMIEDEDENEED